MATSARQRKVGERRLRLSEEETKVLDALTKKHELVQAIIESARRRLLETKGGRRRHDH